MDTNIPLRRKCEDAEDVKLIESLISTTKMAPTSSLNHNKPTVAAKSTLSLSANYEDIDMNEDEEEELKAATLIYDGFSSSVCDMHADREDCCAVAWFGICLRGRNNYLLYKNDMMMMNYAPMPHWYIFVMCVLPFVTYVILFVIVMKGHFIMVDVKSGNEMPYVPNAVSENDNDDDESTIRLSDKGHALLFTITIIYIVILSFTRIFFRNMDRTNRNLLRQRMQRKFNRPVGRPRPRDMTRGHEQCGGCSVYKFEEREYKALLQSRAGREDLCTKLWQLASELCLGALCRYWCIWCGICSLAQENRQLKKLLPASAFDIDFITYQSWEEYVPALVSLRSTSDGSLKSHFSSLSDLSKLLLQYSMSALGLCTLFAISNLSDSFTWPNLIVLVMTLVQAFSLLFVCHWLYNRFDLSLDAVIKFFASGFVYSVFLALIFEMLIGFVLKIFQFSMVFVTVFFTANVLGYSKDDKTGAMSSIEEVVGGLFIILNAFIVTAMTEELCKYFCYWIVRHYDLEQRPFRTSNNINRKYGERTVQTSQSRGCAITVAMVTTALGFACCENLLYIFGYSGGKLENEISTLVVRMLFPLHPIAAAIQSIGVVRKTIERETSLGMGRIVFPAIIFHGSFDFALMLMAYMVHTNEEKNENEDKAKQLALLAITFSFSIFVIISGLVYYFRTAREQRRRLQRMDEGEEEEFFLSEHIASKIGHEKP